MSPAPGEQPVLQQDIARVYIANRGEIGLRILQTCHRLGIGAVLGYAAPDGDSLAVRTALEFGAEDDRYAAAPLGGVAPHTSYENVPVVVASAKAYGCDALHPGYGFLAEKAVAARALAAVDVRFIGPSASMIEMVGNKTQARDLARRCRVPLLPGTGVLGSYEDAAKEAERIGFPIMLKAEDSGGGAGNVIATNEAELKNMFTNLAPRFINLYLERYVSSARHIEIQIAADKHGNVMALGERDCSPQRRFQKVIEESPALVVPPKANEKMITDAIKMAKKAGYHGLGTWEFLYDSVTGKHYFMEVNPRIQVEHPVTEERYGIDLIELQLRIEQGKRLLPQPPARANHVIEARLYAEKTEQGFLPDSGVIQLLSIPELDGVRVDLAYAEGDRVPAGFDTTIAKIIATGQTREEAREKLADMLTKITATGVSTNREFLLWLIGTEEFRGNEVTTTFIENAWNKHRLERFRGVEDFLKGGQFFPETTPVRFSPEIFPQNLIYERKGVSRNYADEVRGFQEANPDNCAFKFGVYQDGSTGIRLAFGFWDFKVMGGTLGAEEGNAVAALFETAHKDGLPVVMVTSSGGARQQENALALQQMDYMMATAQQQFPPNLFVNIYSGPNFGGVTASIAGRPDIQMAVDGSLIGLTGPDVVAKMMGKKDRTALPVGAHTAHDHYKDRQIDLIVGDLEEARLRVLSICSELGLTDSRMSYSFDLRAFDSLTPSTRYDRPPEHRFAARVSGLTGTIFHHAERRLRDSRPKKELTPTERLALINHPLRPTAADLMSPELRVFENLSPLSNKLVVDNIEQYPPIIAAVAQLGGEPVMVLGQQTQRRRDEDGVLHKEYIPQGPNDFRWAQRMVDLAVKRGMPIVLLGDTAGADARLEAEKQGISSEIANFLGRLHKVPVPVISVNLGQNGSGGGLTFVRPLDAAADLSNALTLVSTIDVQTWIVTGKWPTNDAERAKILDQINDGTAAGRLRMRHIDEIIQEPAGGAQNDWPLIAKRLRTFLLTQKAELTALTPGELLTRRYARTKRAAQFATRPTE